MANTYRALGALLVYPDAGLQASASEIGESLSSEGLLSPRKVAALQPLVTDLRDGDIYDLQERYIDLFDRTRSLSLNLYEHVHGESRDRGQAMVALLELYRANGLDLSANQLPDFLPVFLEFLSTRPDEQARSLLGEAAHVLEAMGERLRSRDSRYAAVFNALAELTATKADKAALAALLAEPDDRHDDLEALDKMWAETAVTFGPSDVGCPKAAVLTEAMKTGPAPARERLRVSRREQPRAQ